MTASFPDAPQTFTTKVDIQDTIYAAHVNILQEEVRAVELFLDGLTTSTYSGTFAPTLSWTNLADRLDNIETGLVNGIDGSPYFKRSGDSIYPTPGSVGLTMRTNSADTSNVNLFEAINKANTTLNFNLDYNGIPKVGAYPVLYVNSSEYNALLASVNAAIALATANVGTFNPFLLSNM